MKWNEVAQSCPTLFDPMDSSPPGSAVHGIFQARVLEWVAIAFSKECWALKNWWFGTVVLEKTLESPLDSKEIKPVHLKGNQPWIFIGRSDAETKAQKLWPPDWKSQFIGKDPGAGNDWGQEQKEATENELIGWHYWINGNEFEQTLGDNKGQRSMACCS